MRSVADLAVRPDFVIRAVSCDDVGERWSHPEPRGGHGVVLVRRGRFRRSVRGISALIDPTVAYVALPGAEERFAHPAGGDVCTWVSVTPSLWRRMAGDGPCRAGAIVYVDAGLELAHRRLLAAARAGDVDDAVAEQLLRLLALAVAQVVRGVTPVDGADRAGRDRALVGAARAAIGDAHPASAGLFPLAELLGVSPYRLSRAFTHELGVSLTRYRNRVRVGRALDRLTAGESSLAALAADLGFADQAHLCRTVREQLGHTPTAVRRLLAADRGPGLR
jgi:AraC-like DNA-binding protein